MGYILCGTISSTSPSIHNMIRLGKLIPPLPILYIHSGPCPHPYPVSIIISLLILSSSALYIYIYISPPSAILTEPQYIQSSYYPFWTFQPDSMDISPYPEATTFTNLTAVFLFYLPEIFTNTPVRPSFSLPSYIFLCEPHDWILGRTDIIHHLQTIDDPRSHKPLCCYS